MVVCGGLWWSVVITATPDCNIFNKFRGHKFCHLPYLALCGINITFTQWATIKGRFHYSIKAHFLKHALNQFDRKHRNFTEKHTVKILKIGTPEIITIIVLQLEQLDFTVQYCVQKMQTE